jgi:AraC-like DNA-binding protein
MHALSEPTVGLASAQAIIDFFLQFNMDTHALAKELGIEETLLSEADQRLPLSIYHAIWDLAVKKSQCPELGLSIAQNEGIEDLGLVAHVVYNSATIKEGLEHYIRLFSVVNEAIELECEIINKRCHLRYIYKSPEFYNIPDIERTLAIVVLRTIKAVGLESRFYEVNFQHSKPEYSHKFEDVFPCKVNFEQAQCEVVFDSKMLSMKPKRRNPHMRVATLNYANQILSRLFKRSITSKVKRIIEKHLSDGSFDAEQTAKLLNMSRQTLYRKLKNDDSSYSDLVDEVKQNKAFYLLKQTQLPLTVIAYDLGFSELSAFTRAFKRWTAQTPAEYRKQANGKQASK